MSPGERREGTGRPAPILVVDDEPSVAELLVDILRLEGHEVDTAADGAEAAAPRRQLPLLSFERRADDVPDGLHASVWRDRVECDDCGSAQAALDTRWTPLIEAALAGSNDDVPDLGETLGFIDDTRQARER